MSAIEMMDPKMDAGMIGNQVNRKVLNFEQAVKVAPVVLLSYDASLVIFGSWSFYLKRVNFTKPVSNENEKKLYIALGLWEYFNEQ